MERIEAPKSSLNGKQALPGLPGLAIPYVTASGGHAGFSGRHISEIGCRSPSSDRLTGHICVFHSVQNTTVHLTRDGGLAPWRYSTWSAITDVHQALSVSRHGRGGLVSKLDTGSTPDSLLVRPGKPQVYFEPTSNKKVAQAKYPLGSTGRSPRTSAPPKGTPVHGKWLLHRFWKGVKSGHTATWAYALGYRLAESCKYQLMKR